MAECVVTMDLGAGPDQRIASKVDVRRVTRGDNGELVVAAGKLSVSITSSGPYSTWTGEQGVMYEVDERGTVPGGIKRVVLLPMEATANYRELEDAVPIPPGPEPLGDEIIYGALSTTGSQSNEWVTTELASSPTVVAAAVEAVQGAGLDAATAANINDGSSATGAALSANVVLVRTSDGQRLPADVAVILTIDKTLAEVTADPVADIADIAFEEIV